MFDLFRRLSRFVPNCPRRARREPRPRQSYRPHFDLLEDRCLPTTFTVTSSADSGPNTLRADLAAAANGDTINFNVASPITLTSGTLTATSNVTIQGPGPPSRPSRATTPSASSPSTSGPRPSSPA